MSEWPVSGPKELKRRSVLFICTQSQESSFHCGRCPLSLPYIAHHFPLPRQLNFIAFSGWLFSKAGVLPCSSHKREKWHNSGLLTKCRRDHVVNTEKRVRHSGVADGGDCGQPAGGAATQLFLAVTRQDVSPAVTNHLQIVLRRSWKPRCLEIDSCFKCPLLYGYAAGWVYLSWAQLSHL